METRNDLVRAAITHANERCRMASVTHAAFVRTPSQTIRAKFVARQLAEAIESLEIARDLIAKELS